MPNLNFAELLTTKTDVRNQKSEIRLSVPCPLSSVFYPLQY